MNTKYIGKVIDNNDTEKTGRVQIYIEYLHHGFQPSQYPWCRQDREWTSNIPEIGDFVWCYFVDEKLHRQGYYGNKVTLKDLHEHDETIGSMTGTYPDVKYLKLANGVSLAINSNQTEVSILAGTAEIYIDPNGLISIKNGSHSLKTLIESLIDAVKGMTTTGSPVTHLINGASQALLEAEKLKWAQFTK